HYPVSVQWMFWVGLVVGGRVGAFVWPADQVWELFGGDSPVVGVKDPGHGEGGSGGFGQVVADWSGLQYSALHSGGGQYVIKVFCGYPLGHIDDDCCGCFGVFKSVVVVLYVVAGFCRG